MLACVGDEVFAAGDVLEEPGLEICAMLRKMCRAGYHWRRPCLEGIRAGQGIMGRGHSGRDALDGVVGVPFLSFGSKV